MGNEINYKEEVLKVYPYAYVYYNTLFGQYSILTSPHEVAGRGKGESTAWEHAYKSTIATPTTITVTGCGHQCTFYKEHSISDFSSEKSCRQQKGMYSTRDELFVNCPLKTSPITIMLKK